MCEMTDTDQVVRKPRFIYVAGPYSSGDPVVNTRNAVLAGDELVRHGYVPFIPHLSMLWHFISPHDIHFWYDYDIEWLYKCHAVLRLPGESTGADHEVNAAEMLGIPVYYSIEELLSGHR